MSYKSVRIMDGVYHISDPLGVYSTLIVGSRRALLVDTGSGLGDLRGVVEGLTDRPLTVVNTHGHVDHISGDYQFERVLIPEADFSAALLNSGPYPRRRLLELAPEIPEGFDAGAYLSYGLANAVAMAPGARFELGGETVQSVPLPNHTPGSTGYICLERRLLLSGDAAAPMTYLFFGESCALGEHIRILERLLRDRRFDALLCAHSGSVFTKKDLAVFRDCAAQAAATGRGHVFHDPIFRDYEGVKYTYVSPDDPTDCAVVVYSRNKTERSNTMGAVEKIKEFQETVTVHAEGRKEIKPPPPRYEPGNDRWKIEKQEFKGKEIDVLYRKGVPGLTREEMDAARAQGITPSNFKYAAKLDPGMNEEEDGIIRMRDLPVLMRDGTTLYTDVYYHKDTPWPMPLIVCWSPFGKKPADGAENWKLMGVPPHTVSKLAKFESADPAYWCHYGYAVANPDSRGIANSEGDTSNFGLQDGEDGYDFIEWAAKQPWCSGRVGLFGNSGVGMTQWRIAAEQPPHLTCIAPWEATGDMYRESFAFGGIPSAQFNEGIMNSLANKTYVEEGPNMLYTNPLINEYWESKIPRWENIRIPAYVCAGWCHFHLRGSFEGFRRIRSPKKWMRAHRDMEWPDTYNPENLEDLRRFYDRYLKGIRNGWEFTPKVRVEVMDAYGYSKKVNRPEDEFPLARTEYRKLYLDADSAKMSYSPFTQEAEAVYDPETERSYFEFKVEEETEITGYMKLHAFVEARDHTNMDMFVWVKKYNADGEYVPVHCMKENYRGAWGYMRCSHRELDPKWSSDFQPVQAHRKEEPMEPGKVYEVDVEIWPHSRVWHKGEIIRLEIAGQFIRTDWYEDNSMAFDVDNGSQCVIHTGGKYASYLQIPFIPPKYKSGDYVYED